MNILHHKSWHVRTKTNIARVRRDEAKAAEEEKRRLDRQILAENERRLQILRSKADERMETMFGRTESFQSSSKDACIHDETGHVNFFQDLEREERKNLGVGNAEYEEEKKKEQHQWNSKVGIQKMFAEGTNEFDKKQEWYEQLPTKRAEVKPMQYVLPQIAKKIEEELKEKEIKHKKKKKEKKKRRHSNSSSSDDDERKHRKKKKKKSKRNRSEERRAYEAEKQRKLAVMRDERMKREREEKLRQERLLHPEKFKPEAAKKQKYNSQFNPDLAR